MGLPMAKRLIDAGYSLVSMVHRDPRPGETLEKLGASIVAGPAQVAREAEIILLVLPDDAAVRRVTEGPEGLCSIDLSGKIVVEMSTTLPETLVQAAEALQARGAEVLDAPVSGGRAGAESGGLTLMVGGAQGVLESVAQVFRVLASAVFHVGDLGAGKTVKLINQLLNGIHMAAFSEALVLAEKAGVDPEALMSVLLKSSGFSKVMELKYEKFIKTSDFTPSFRLNLMRKDVRLAVSMAERVGAPVWLGSQAYQFYQGCAAQGHDDRDYSVISRYLADMSGTKR